MNQMMAVQGADSRLNSLTCFLVEKVENRWILAIHTFQAIHVDSIPG